MSLQQWKDRLTWIFRRDKAEAELDDEVRAHLAIETRRRMEAGESSEFARAAARKDFGNELLVKETTRGMWTWQWLEEFWRDLAYGFRVLRKNPGFAAIAILTLALGIGCNTAMFSIINSVLLRPLPFHESERLIYMREAQPSAGYPSMALNGQNYLDWKAQNHTLADAAIYGGAQNYNASGAGSPETVRGVQTEANFTSVLGAQPLRGRTFAPGEDMPGHNRVVLLSYSFWQQHYGEREDAIGATLNLDTRPYTVVGVMPAWFNLPARTQLWIPIDMSEQRKEPRDNHSYRAIGRLKTGVTFAQARADLETISARLAEQYPQTNRGVAPSLEPLKEHFTSDSRQQLLVLMAAVALVLLVACANVANLLLARATGRQREMALRAALGARRVRLIRQLLTESVLLSVLGATFGLFLAWGCIAVVQNSIDLPIPRVTPIQLDWTVLAFAGFVSVGVGLLFGMAPAFQVSVTRLALELKTAAQSVASAGEWRNRLRDGLVVGEIALSLTLLMGAGLLLRSFVHMRSTDIGVARENVVTLALVLPSENYKTTLARQNFYEHLLDMVRFEPGVQNAAISLLFPLDANRGKSIKLPGQNDPNQVRAILWNVATNDYFRTLGIPLISGRTFTAQDQESTAQAMDRLDAILERDPNSKQTENYPIVVNVTMAKTFFPGQDAVGKSIIMGNQSGQIVGVVGDVKQESIREPAQPQAYGPLTAEINNHWFPAAISIRATAPPASVIAAARHDLAQLDRSLSFFNIRTMDELIAENMQDTTLQTTLLGTFAGMALLLAALGLYGVMAYAVAQRTREIGIRMALGAYPGSVLGMVMGRGARLTLAGVLLGTPSAFGLARLMSSLLFGVGASDPLTFAGVAVLLILVALAACYVPARRAMHVDPMIALRYE